MSAFLSILEIHFNFILVFALGNLTKHIFFRSYQEPASDSQASYFKLPAATEICLNFCFGILSFSLIGLLSIISFNPALFVKLAVACLFFSWIFIKYRLHNKHNLSYLAGFYCKYSLVSLLFFAPFAIFLLSHFSSAEITTGIDPWQLIARTASYNVPDHYLQWLVSDNIYHSKALETHFNPDGKQLWSAGDRPALIALLEATFSHLTDNKNFTLYFLRIIFISTFLFFPLLSLVVHEFKVKSKLILAVIILFFCTHPFFLINFIYTWPKVAGLAFGINGFFLLNRFFNDKKTIFVVASGLSFAFGIISHNAALFCLLAAFLYFFAKSLLWPTNIYKNPTGILAFIIPLILVTQIHSRLLASVTNQTNLLPRVQFCRGGSYAFPTPVESLAQSCKKYLEKYGWEGAIADRKESLSRAFNFNSSYEFAIIKALFSDSPEARQSRLKNKFGHYLLIVPETIGQFSLLIQGILMVLYLLAWLFKFSAFYFTNSSLIAPVGFMLLAAFGSALGEYTEMSSHVVPYIVPLFIHLGLLIEISRLSKILFAIYSSVMIGLSMITCFAMFAAN